MNAVNFLAVPASTAELQFICLLNLLTIIMIVRICDTCLFFVTSYGVDFLLLFEEKQRTHHTNVLFI